MTESMTDWNKEWKACAKEASDEADARAMEIWQELNDARARSGADRDTPLAVQFARALRAETSDKQEAYRSAIKACEKIQRNSWGEKYNMFGKDLAEQCIEAIQRLLDKDSK